MRKRISKYEGKSKIGTKKDRRILKFGDKAKIIIRDHKGYKKVKRNVYFQSGKGTYIKFQNKDVPIQYTNWNNTGHTLHIL